MLHGAGETAQVDAGQQVPRQLKGQEGVDATLAYYCDSSLNVEEFAEQLRKRLEEMQSSGLLAKLLAPVLAIMEEHGEVDPVRRAAMLKELSSLTGERPGSMSFKEATTAQRLLADRRMLTAPTAPTGRFQRCWKRCR